MNPTQKTSGQQNDMSTLAKDARSLVTATTDVATQKIGEVRHQVAEKVKSAKESVGRFRDQAVECAKATDRTVRRYPYQALGIALGVGAIVGLFVFRPRSRSRNGDQSRHETW